MRQKGFAPVLVVLIFMIISVGGVLIYFYQNNLTKSTEPIIQTTSPVTTPTSKIKISSPSAASESNKKTYSNNEFNFSFQYPSFLKLTESKITSRSNYTDKVTFINLTGNGLNINMSLEPNPKRLSINDWLKNLSKSESEVCEIDCPGFSNPTQKINIAGKDGLSQNLGSVVSSLNFYLPLNAQTVLWADINHPLKMYPTDDDKKLLISILNSLSFDLINQAGQMVNWKTYKNNKFEIEFKYPEDFSIKEELGGEGNVLYIDVTKVKEFYRVEMGRPASYVGLWEHFRSNQTINVNNISWIIVPPAEYCDAGQCGPTSPAFYVKTENYYVAISWNNNTSSEETSKKILQTIRLLK